MTNHLGNVLVTLSDKKIPHTPNGTTIDYYNADVITANDYTPFGMQMVGRKYSQANTKYRYGFNGKENDNDVKGEANQQDYGMRIYDPRLGKFLSVDPLAAKYPFYTPYAFAGNDVLRCVDLDGAEPTSRTEAWKPRKFRSTVSSFDVYDKVNHQIFNVHLANDPNTGKTWIVSDDGQSQGKHFYLRNDNRSTNSIEYYTENGTNYLVNGHFEMFQTQNQKEQKASADVPNLILGFLGGGAAVAVAAPVVIPYASTAAATYGTGVLAASGGVRAVGAVANAGFQYLQNAPDHGWGTDNIKNMNVTSIGLTALNPAAIFTNAVGSNFGKITFTTGTSQAIGGNNFNLKSAATGATIDFLGGKLGDGLGGLAGKYGGFKPIQKAAVENVLGGAVTTPANTIAEQATKNDKP